MPAEIDKLKHSIAGAIAGGVSSIVTCPLDVVKTRLQNQRMISTASISHRATTPLYHGTGDALKKIWIEEGIQGLYRGLGPTMYGYLPTWAIYFSAYDYFKLALSDNTDGKRDQSQCIVHIISAMGAGAISTIATNPLWVIKTRFMTQNQTTSYKYKNTYDAFVKIYTYEGVKGFYKGLGLSLIGVSHVAVQFPLYEKMKDWLRSEQEGLSNTSILLASSASKMAASFATYPHEMIRTRIQNQTVRPFKYENIWHAIKVIEKEEGFTAFYKGMATNLLRTVPASALTILIYEMLIKELNSISSPSKHC